MALDKSVLQRELYTACRQRGKNVEFVESLTDDAFTMTVTPSPTAPVTITSLELAENDDLNGFIELVLADAGVI